MFTGYSDFSNDFTYLLRSLPERRSNGWHSLLVACNFVTDFFCLNTCQDLKVLKCPVEIERIHMLSNCCLNIVGCLLIKPIGMVVS